MAQANSYDCYSDFVIRTPIFSLNKLAEIPSHPDHLMKFLKERWGDSVLRDAIQLASPSLFKQLTIEIGAGNLSESVANSLFRYYIRMCYRCTPFGLFAGVGTGKITSDTNLQLKGIEDHLLKCRLDMEFLGAQVLKWTNDPKIRTQLNFQANTSLYKIGSKWRYIEVYFQGNARKKYRIVSVDQHPVLDELISDSGIFRTWSFLMERVIGMGYGEDEARDFINELLDSQILISELYPNLTGQEFSTRLLEKFNIIKEIQAGNKLFLNLAERISQLTQPGTLSSQFQDIVKIAEKTGVVYNQAHLIQADLQSSYENAEISRDLSNKVLMGIRILKALSRQRPNKILEGFKEYFVDRFGTKEVSLSLVMDAEFGVALLGPQAQQLSDPGPLLDSLDFPIGVVPEKASNPHPILMSKIRLALKSESTYITLDKKDLRDLGIQKGKWPNQLFALCRLNGNSDNWSVIFDLASRGNPASILGRFGFMEPEGKLNLHLREMVRDDISNNPDHLLAEIVHLPEDRTGNILQRPSYYDWEIPYLAGPGNEASVIHPNDILVSVINNKVVLKQKITKKRILPRLTNAHNYQSRQLPLYQFLAECINQDSNSGYFPNWGWLSEMYDFLPGIRYGSLVLSQPRWRVKVDAKLKRTDKKGLDLYDQILLWVDNHKLPGRVVWINGAHEMFIDWSNVNIVMSVWELIRKRNYVLFKDNPYNPGSPVRSEGGLHANEVLLTYKKSQL